MEINQINNVNPNINNVNPVVNPNINNVNPVVNPNINIVNPNINIVNPNINNVLENVVEIKKIFEKKDYTSFDIYGNNKYNSENIIFGKVEIFFENKISKIKLHTIFVPSEYAKKWLKNNKERLGSKAHGQKEIHKYKKYSLFKIKIIKSKFDKVVEENINNDELIENINIHMKEIIQKLNTRTRHEYKFTPNKL
jgi:hypothetical protein